MRVIVLTALVLVAAGCGGSDSPSSPPRATNKTWEVLTIEQNFAPPFSTIAVGDTVAWSFNKASDGLGHDVHFNPRITGSPTDIGTPGKPITSGTQTRVFATKGDFHYVCDLHGGMTGEVIVE